MNRKEVILLSEDINPLNSVYQFDLKPDFKVSQNWTSLFQRPFSISERAQIINIYLEKNNVDAFNGKAVRLDKIKNLGETTFLNISMIDFYDFLSTTMVYKQKASLITFCEDHNRLKEKELIENYCRSIEGIESNSSFEKIITQNDVSNIIAVSILVEDSNGDVGIVHRSEKVAVSSGVFGVTVTGVLDELDFLEEDPFTACAKRELKEELNINVDSLDFDELVMSKQKLQPIVLFNLKLDQTWKDLLPSIKMAEDFKKEAQGFFAVPVSKLSDLLASETFSEAAAYQIWKRSDCS